MVKKEHNCVMIFHHGTDSISMDKSMQRIEIIKIENDLSIYRIEKKFQKMIGGGCALMKRVLVSIFGHEW